MSKSIVIVYHSGYGHTRKIAEAVAEGGGGRLLDIDADGNLPEDGGTSWPPPTRSCSVRPRTWGT